MRVVDGEEEVAVGGHGEDIDDLQEEAVAVAGGRGEDSDDRREEAVASGRGYGYSGRRKRRPRERAAATCDCSGRKGGKEDLAAGSRADWRKVRAAVVRRGQQQSDEGCGSGRGRRLWRQREERLAVVAAESKGGSGIGRRQEQGGLCMGGEATGGGDAGEGREMEEMTGGVGLQAADRAGSYNRQRHEFAATAGSRGGTAVRWCKRSGRQQRALRHECAPTRKFLRAGASAMGSVDVAASGEDGSVVAEEEGIG
ncbi:hypothetical protein B296_00035439 [Ensete ventricosum]|uniref:DUF834 domain-containing protein n=1 Tax=Ensete ventricosum TaxID=4639 RepID=A0A426YX43_ENSVE|nr:hypothetical protein B296_00035439 [Ensete ventricosum]